MNTPDDHGWDLRESCEGNLPESDEAFDKNFWPVREYVVWFANR